MAEEIGLGSFEAQMIQKLKITVHPFITKEYPNAISEVINLKQTGMVESYYEELEGFCNLLQLSEEDALRIFINNLNLKIFRLVRFFCPSSLTHALKLAKQLEFLFDDELPMNSSSPDPNTIPSFKQTIISIPPKQSSSPTILTKPTNSFMETTANPLFPLNPFQKIPILEMLAVEEGKNFNHDEVLSEMVIGHTKYLTAGSVLLKNILHCVAGYRVGFVDVCKKFEGEYSKVFLFENKLIMVYDPYGFRLLVMGKRNQCILEQVLVGIKNMDLLDWPSLFLSHIIKQKVEDAAIHYKAVGVIGNLVHSSPNIKKEIVVAGALQLVIGLFISCCSDNQRETTLLLGQVAATDSDCKVHIVQRGVVRHLIEMLHSSVVQIKEMSAFTLGRLTQDTLKHTGITHYDGLMPLLKLLNSKNGSLQHNVAFALYGLADNEDKISDFIREGGVQWLQDGEFIVQAQHVRGSFAVVCVGVSMALKMVKCHLDGDKQKQLSKGRDIGSISVTILDEVVIAFPSFSFSGSGVLTKLSFSIYVFIIDEVAQAVEPLTLVPLFNGCKQTIFIEDSAQLPSTVISLLVEKFGYGIVVDLLRNTKETMDITKRILILTEPHVWGALLVACKIYHHVEMGELAAKNLLFLDPNHVGVGVAGFVLLVSEEKVIAIKMDDTIALGFDVFTWWYNKEDSELMVIFMSDTSKGHKAGQFTSFFLIGSNDIFTGFTIEFVEIAWDVDADTIKTLVGKQIGKCIVKLDSIVKMFEPKPEHRKRMALNCKEAPLDIDIKNAGKVLVLDTKKLPLVGEVGIDADLVRMKENAMGSPGFSCDSALQGTYIVKTQDKMAKFSFQVQPTELKHGSVMVAAITSYPNTLIPSVMLGASVVAKNAYEQSLHVKFWIQTSLASSSRVVTRYLLQSGLKTGNSKIMFMFILEDKDDLKGRVLL